MESAPPIDPAPPRAVPAGPGVQLGKAGGGWRQRTWRWAAGLPHARLAIVALAAVLRLWQLDLRPPHFDEGVNGWFLDQMQKNGFYKYDPTNYHGPLHFYILFVFKCLLGRNLWALRLPVALAGIFTVDWIFRFERFFGRRACAWAALAMAVSPGFVFYHRYAIHETWLVFFMVLGWWGVVGLWRQGSRRYLWATGLGLTGMILIKETYVIHLVCLGVAIPCAIFLETVFAQEPAFGKPPADMSQMLDARPAPQSWRGRDLVAVAGVGLAAILFFYSANGLHPEALKGLYKTFGYWQHKGDDGEGHQKPFVYWLQLIPHYEYLIAVGLAAAIFLAVAPITPGRPTRVLSIYALGVLFAYSLIHYKTPWCILAIGWPFFFLAGVAESLAARSLPRPLGWLTLLAGLALSGWSGWRAVRLNFYHYDDEQEKYVYVHTYRSVYEFTRPLLDLAAEDPVNYHMHGLIFTDSSHPLPWMLGDFSHVGYYGHGRLPADMHADFYLVSEERDNEIEKYLDADFFKETLPLRPSLKPLTLYLRYSMFSHLMPEREPEFLYSPPPAKPPETEK